MMDSIKIPVHAGTVIKKSMIALAICLIKRKPPNTSAKEFCIAVQNKYRESLKPNLNDELSSNVYDIILSNPEIVEDSKCHVATKQELVNFSLNNTQEDTIKKIHLKINFQIIHAIKSVKSYLAENNVYIQSQNISDTQKSNLDSQSSKKGTNEQLQNEKKLTSLNTSMLILLEFIVHTPENFYNDDVIVYISDIAGKVVDLMYEKKIYVSALNQIMSLIDENIQNMLTDTDKSNRQYFSIVFLLNKSQAAIRHTIVVLISKIENFLNILKSYDNDEIIELNEIDETDNLFYVFELLDELYKMYKCEVGDISSIDIEAQNVQCLNDVSNRQPDVSDKASVLDKMTEVLNRTVMECMDAYPLISFWAMEIVNSNRSTVEVMDL